MIAKLLTIEEMKQSIAEHYVSCFKYVRVSSDYRFVFAGEWLTPDHRQMIDDGEAVHSAAYAKVYRATEAKPLRVEIEGHSMTLKAYAAPDDEENIRLLLS